MLVSEYGTDTARGLTACQSQAVFEISGFAEPNSYDPRWLISHRWFSNTQSLSKCELAQRKSSVFKSVVKHIHNLEQCKVWISVEKYVVMKYMSILCSNPSVNRTKRIPNGNLNNLFKGFVGIWTIVACCYHSHRHLLTVNISKLHWQDNDIGRKHSSRVDDHHNNTLNTMLKIYDTRKNGDIP